MVQPVASVVLMGPGMMKTVATVAALATLTITSVAFADDTTDLGMAADAAAKTHDWNDVSHVNGRLVPVGASDEYKLSHKRVNLALDPLTLLVGWIDLEAQVAISDHVAISGSFATMTVDSTTGIGAALTAPLYLRRVFSGPYLEPGLVVYKFSDENGSSTTAGPQMSAGWQWMFDSGFNVAVAVGAARLGGGDEGDGGAVPQGYFRTGYAF